MSVPAECVELCMGLQHINLLLQFFAVLKNALVDFAVCHHVTLYCIDCVIKQHTV